MGKKRGYRSINYKRKVNNHKKPFYWKIQTTPHWNPSIQPLLPNTQHSNPNSIDTTITQNSIILSNVSSFDEQIINDIVNPTQSTNNTFYHNPFNIPMNRFESLILNLGPNYIPPPDKQIKFKNLLEAYTLFTRKVRIKYHFRDRDDSIPKFWVPNTLFKPPKATSNVETYLSNSLHRIRCNFPNRSQLFKLKQKYSHPSIINSTLHKLRSNKNIKILSTDKNLGFCIVPIDWYNNEIYRHLDEKSSYEVIYDNNSINNEIKSYKEFKIFFLSNLYEKIQKTLEVHNQLKINSNELTVEAKYILQIPKSGLFDFCKFYVLPKVHKLSVINQTLVGRPICSGCKFPTYLLSKFIDQTLQPIVQSMSTYLRNSTDLIKSITKLEFDSEIILITMDIVNLYPSIPIDEGISYVKDAMIDFEEKERNLLIDLLIIVLKQNVISFEEKVYRQISGTATGTPCAVVFANLFLKALESKFINLLDTSDYPLFFKRYIDDIFMIARNLEHAKLLVNTYDNLHPNIKITYKFSSISVDYLDITIYKSQLTNLMTSCELFTKLYQKSMNKYIYIPPSSFHPKHIYKSFIKGEIRRYCLLNTTEHDYDESKQCFRNRLMSRGYEPAFLNPLFNIRFDRNQLLSHKPTLSKQPTTLILPYDSTTRYLKINRYITIEKIASSLVEIEQPIVSHTLGKKLKHIFLYN